jgi:hypothetical protein
MPTHTRSARKDPSRELGTNRRESIAAFERWQRSWSTSFRPAVPLSNTDAVLLPRRTKRPDLTHSLHR